MSAPGKFLLGFGALLAVPGALTREHVRGRRERFPPPLLLFLIANLLFLAAPAITRAGGFAVPLRERIASGAIARDAVRTRFLRMESVDFEAIDVRFRRMADIQAKALAILLVPAFAAALALTRLRRREPLRTHLVFATHFLAFALLLLLVAGVLLALLPGARALNAGALAVLVAAASALHLYPALRRAYGDARFAAGVRAVVLATAFAGLLALYRFLLFFTVLYSV